MTPPPSGSVLSAPFLRATRTGLELDLVVQPRASRSRIAGLLGGRLKVQLAAPPVDGAANDALIDLFASLVGVPRRDVSIVRGESSRRKTLAIQGIDGAAAQGLASMVSP
jgi:uncharacterized protein (TIGR00251 family)